MNNSNILKAQLIYNLMLGTALIVGLPFWGTSLLRPKRRSVVMARLGFPHPVFPSPSTLDAKPIWVHALSVGEVQSAEPLVHALIVQRQVPIVFSASTRSGYDMAVKLFNTVARRIIYFPFDLPFSVRRVIHAVAPRQVIVVETDIWPNFLFELQKRRIPAALVNARLSERSVSGYRKVRWLLQPTLQAFTTICVQSPNEARHFGHLGFPAQRITVTGSIKFDQPIEKNPQQTGQSVRKRLGLSAERRIIVAGSTHTGEDEPILQSFSHLRRRHPQLLLIIAPRHPQRAGAVAAMAEHHGLPWAYLSSLEPHPTSEPPIAVLIVNTLGLLRTLYATADLAFVGGSLIPEGGHNPLEPAALAKPILFGPHMHNCAAVADQLEKHGGARRVRDQGELTSALETLLTDQCLRRTMGERAQSVLKANQGAVQRTLNAIGQT